MRATTSFSILYMSCGSLLLFDTTIIEQSKGIALKTPSSKFIFSSFTGMTSARRFSTSLILSKGMSFARGLSKPPESIFKTRCISCIFSEPNISVCLGISISIFITPVLINYIHFIYSFAGAIKFSSRNHI
ncbi:hypothetical protein C5S29_14560 [ANME-1 cluster archaeon GoMg3.2]|nr:hypothetical protein [ANME-1 cluster archaeon GoMg3.2]